MRIITVNASSRWPMAGACRAGSQSQQAVNLTVAAQLSGAMVYFLKASFPAHTCRALLPPRRAHEHLKAGSRYGDSLI